MSDIADGFAVGRLSPLKVGSVSPWATPAAGRAASDLRPTSEKGATVRPVTHGQLKITHDYSRFPTFHYRELSETIPNGRFGVSTFQTFPKLSKIAFSPCAASKRLRRSRSLPKTPVFIGCAAFRPVQNFSKPALPFFLFRLTSASPRDTLPSTFPLAAMACHSLA